MAAAVVPFAAFAQSHVSGVVKNPNGQALPFVIVHVDGTYNTTQTDMEGKFVLRGVTGPQYCLTVQMAGFETYRKCYTLPNDTAPAITMLTGVYMRDEVIVSSTRAENGSGMAYTNVSKEEIAGLNYGQDLPYILNLQPSVVTTSDAGAGVGYTGIRIRGSDGTRVNVTINGIPVNDAESQGTFFVDIPDIASSTENIQVQRGVGTSSNGAGAFGGSINLQTDALVKNPYSELTVSGGSFNTWRTTAKAGTGLLNNKWSFETRLSRLMSDGYIDRASSDLASWYASGAYYGNRLTVKAITFSGHERTYQAWYGVPEDSLKAGNRTFNPAGMYFDASGNIRYYENQVDDYRQDYYQLHFIARGNEKWTFNWALHATKGKGFYEEFREDNSYSSYNLVNPVIGADTLYTTDLVRRKWLDNWFYGITYGVNYTNSRNIRLTIGGAANRYDGDHYGEVIWAEVLPAGTAPEHRYYKDNATKTDVNVFTKLNWQAAEKINVFVDLQYRNVNYSFTGLDSTGSQLPQDVALSFFNPKAGVTYYANARNIFYASFSTGNKEPNRNDFTESSPESRPEHETLYDAEAGWKFHSEIFAADVNLYYMHYVNQLVLTGRVNDVGAYTRENVPVSFRRGAEVAFGWNITKQINLLANATFSQNKVEGFSEFLDDYDNGGQVQNVYTGSTDLAFSPAVISGMQLAWQHPQGFRAALQGKYVGKQYLDNTSNETRKIDPYFTANLNLSWNVFGPENNPGQKTRTSSLTVSLLVNNLFNTLYSSNGYTYGYIYGGQTSYYNYYYPQAGINFLGMVSVKFGGKPFMSGTN